MSNYSRRKNRIRADHAFHATWRRGEAVPPVEEFFPIEAYDISSDGIALITDIFRPGESIVLLLGPPLENPALVVAEVVHVTAMRFGAVFHPVTGCGFTQRLSEDIVRQYALHAMVEHTPDSPTATSDLWREPQPEKPKKFGASLKR